VEPIAQLTAVFGDVTVIVPVDGGGGAGDPPKAIRKITPLLAEPPAGAVPYKYPSAACTKPARG
jgi:hypothetical protein